jgi:hypothetical protein
VNYVLLPSRAALDPDEDESIFEDSKHYNGERGSAAETFLARFAPLANLVLRTDRGQS